MKRKPLIIGRVLKPQALKGEMKLKSEARDINIFRELPFVFIKIADNLVRYDVENGRIYKNFAYLKLKNIDSPEAVEKLRGCYIYAEREYVSAKAEDEQYIADVIGLEVIGNKGKKYGTVTDVLQNGAADVYCVKSKDGSFMFPSVKNVILEIDVDANILTIDEEHIGEVAIYD